MKKILLIISVVLLAIVGFSCSADLHDSLISSETVSDTQPSAVAVSEVESAAETQIEDDFETVYSAPEISVELLNDCYEVGLVTKILMYQILVFNHPLDTAVVTNGSYDLSQGLIQGDIDYNHCVYNDEFLFDGNVSYRYHYGDGDSIEVLTCDNLTYVEIASEKSYVLSFHMEYKEAQNYIEFTDFTCNGTEYQDYRQSYTYGY
ncbi:MAG: hypothetical protein K6F82_06480 [Sphaerochaetaceae bacterium]|nr:hypothetical protein [Sphaerochaetaceae bacterium]